MKTQSCVETEKRQVNRQICNKKRSEIFVEELFTKDYLSSHQVMFLFFFLTFCYTFILHQTQIIFLSLE